MSRQSVSGLAIKDMLQLIESGRVLIAWVTQPKRNTP